MKRSMVLVGVVLALSACGNQRDAAAPAAAEVAPAAEIAAPAATPAQPQ
jgi:hypothetical protein